MFHPLLSKLLLNCWCLVTQFCLTLCNSMDCSTPGLSVPSPAVCPNSCPLRWWCHPAISSSDAFFFFCLQSFPASGSFPMSPALSITWPKYCSFSFSISHSNEYSRLTSFRIDWFDLLAVQGTLRSLLQHHSSKASFFGTLPSFSPTLTSVNDY